MDITKIVTDKASELEKMLSTKTGQCWSIDDLNIMAQIRLSNEEGEATIANIEIGKAKFDSGVLVAVKMIGQKELDARIKALSK